MSHALTVVSPDAPAPRKAKEREKIYLIEMPPAGNWFVKTKTRRGKTIWYLRLCITGLHPRLYGPFGSKRHGMLFLDEVLDALLVPIADVEAEIGKWKLREPFAHAWLPIVEHPLVMHHRKS